MGTNSGISWSKNGFIAYSDLSSSTNLSITKLESIKGSTWRISPKKTYQIKTSPTSKLSELSVVQWSNSGNDLALIDTAGNLTILGTGIVKPNPTSPPQLACYEDIEILYQDHIADYSNNNTKTPLKTDEFFTSAVAFKWLNVDKPVISNSPAARINQTYNYAVHQYKSYGTVHPAQGKSGLFIIRKNGSLNFYYQTLNPVIEYKKVTLFLENDHNNWLKYASIGYNRDGSVIIATFSALTNSLNVYKVVVDYGTSSTTKLNPVLKLDRLVKQNIPRIGENGLSLNLASLDIISPNFSQETELDILLNFEGDGVGPGQSLLQKFQISNEFKGFTFAKDSSPENIDGFANLQLISQCIIDGKIVNVAFKNFDFLIILFTSKGEVQIRHRKSLKEHATNPASVSSLIDVGFKFPKPEEPVQQTSISSCLCGYLTLTDNKLRFYNVYRPDDLEWTDEAITQVAGGISYSFATACFTNFSADELIIVVQNELSKIKDPSIKSKLVLKILEESHRGLNFSLEHSKDHIDKLLVNPPIQKLLSLQYSLGKYVATNEQSSIALGILNLRLISFSIMLSMRTLFHQQQRIARKGNVENLADSIYRSESLLSTIGAINWFIEFLIFTIQEFIELSANREHKTIIYGLLLSKIPRSLMLYSLHGIKRVDGLLSNKLEEISKIKNPNNALQFDLLNHSYSRLKYLLGIVDLDLFEKFLSQIETIFIKNISDPALSVKVEQDLIFRNQVPDSFKALIPQLYTKFQEIFQDLDLSALYFHDTKWLNFQIKELDPPSKTFLSPDDKIPVSFNLNQEIIDDITKIRIIKKDKLKKCVRCEYVTSEGNSDEFGILPKDTLGPNLNQYWPFAFQRTCLCGSCWVYVNQDEIIS